MNATSHSLPKGSLIAGSDFNTTPLAGATRPVRDDALILRGVTRCYSEKLALAGLDMEIHRGEVVGILGRNGAGKSTAVRIICGLDSDYGGDVRLGGMRPAEATRLGMVGYCSQDVSLYTSLSVRNNLTYFAKLAGRDRKRADPLCVQVLDELGLADSHREVVEKLSGGMRRRVHLAAALITEAPYMILDEPTAGVDFDSTELVSTAVRRAADRGSAILYTSHELSHVEQLCDRVIVLASGVAIESGTVAEIAQRVGATVRLLFESRAEREAAREHFAAPGTSVRGATELEVPQVVIKERTRSNEVSAAAAYCEAHGWTIIGLELVPAGLEAIVRSLTSADRETSNDPA